MAKRKPRKKNRKRSAAAKRAFKKTGLYRYLQRKKKGRKRGKKKGYHRKSRGGHKRKKGYHRKVRHGILGAKARAAARGMQSVMRKKLIDKGYTPKQASKIIARLHRIKTNAVKRSLKSEQAMRNVFSGIGAAGAAEHGKRQRFANFFRGLGGVGKVAV